MPGRTFTFGLLALVALGIVACVDIPDNMRAQFAPAGPNDRTNYVPNRHGTAPPNTPDPMLPWDAGAPAVATPPDAGAETKPVPATPPASDGGVA